MNLKKEAALMMLTQFATTEILPEENQETFSDRVLLVLQQQQRSKAWLAEQIGVSKQALNYILMHSSKKKCINEIAAALDVNPEWLKTGKGPIVISLHAREDIKFIPVLSMENLMVSHTTNTLAVSASYASECFAVILNNHSMEPLFTEGSLLICDPTKKAKNGDFILFSLAQDKTIYFRQFFKEGQDYYFKAVTAMYETIKHHDITLYGVLVESRHHFNVSKK